MNWRKVRWMLWRIPAIRYYLLKFTLESQIVFDFDEALKTTGDTGVYLEYAHARACTSLGKLMGRRSISIGIRNVFLFN